MKVINSFDIDGVIHFDQIEGGLRPRDQDILITGRSFEEETETLEFLRSEGILNKVYFNPLKFHEKTRETSGIHKAYIINQLYKDGVHVRAHFEDDPIQKLVIEDSVENEAFNVIHIVSNLTELENKKR